MKWILDGTPIERLAFMRAPYADRAGNAGGSTCRASGSISSSAGRTARRIRCGSRVRRCRDRRLPRALERAGRPEIWRPKRPRIEHGDMLSPDLMPRVKALGVVVVQNPSHFTFPEMFLRATGLSASPGCSR